MGWSPASGCKGKIVRALDWIGAMVVAFVLAIGLYNIALWTVRSYRNRRD